MWLYSTTAGSTVSNKWLFITYTFVLCVICNRCSSTSQALQQMAKTFIRRVGVVVPSIAAPQYSTTTGRAALLWNDVTSPFVPRQKTSVVEFPVLLFAIRYGPIDNDETILPTTPSNSNSNTDTHPSMSTPPLPPTTTTIDSDANEGDDAFTSERMALRKVVNDVLAVKDPQHIPSILTKNIELILSCMTTEDGAVLVESVIEDILSDQPDANTATMVLEAIDIIMAFGEEFVQYTSQIEKQNQSLLGKIIKTMSLSSTSTSSTSTNDKAPPQRGGPSREDELDIVFEKERDQFTPGFLRHIDNECQRIASAPSMTMESTRLLETLRIIQSRVLEEMCSNDLGEAAQVLGQIIGYDTKMERLAVLDAGLMVRGVTFGEELFALTTEAIRGFQNVIPIPDPDLVMRVQQIHDHLQLYMAKEKH